MDKEVLLEWMKQVYYFLTFGLMVGSILTCIFVLIFNFFDEERVNKISSILKDITLLLAINLIGFYWLFYNNFNTNPL